MRMHITLYKISKGNFIMVGQNNELFSQKLFRPNMLKIRQF